jgi:hypothetical protein
MTEKLSAFIDDALRRGEMEALLHELESDNNKKTLELYLLMRDMLQNSHAVAITADFPEKTLQMIRRESTQKMAPSSFQRSRPSWRPALAVTAIFVIGLVGLMTWLVDPSFKAPEQVADSAMPDKIAPSATSKVVAPSALVANEQTSDDSGSEPQDHFEPDPYFFAHQELAPMGSFYDAYPNIHTVSGIK